MNGMQVFLTRDDTVGIFLRDAEKVCGPDLKPNSNGGVYNHMAMMWKPKAKDWIVDTTKDLSDYETLTSLTPEESEQVFDLIKEVLQERKRGEV